MFRRIALRLRAIARRNTLDREMRDEMDAHLVEATDRLIARGMSPEAARFEARREFGNIGVLQEEARDARQTQWIESVAGDVRFAFRHFSRRPLSALTIVVVLALGIGGHSAVFSILQAVVVRPAPGVPDDDALVLLRTKQRPVEMTEWFSREVSYPEFRELARLRDVFSATAAWVTHDVTVDVTANEGTMGRSHFVTDGFFGAVGVPLALGAGLPPSSGAEGEPAAIISHTMWQEAFDGALDVVGKTVRVNDVAVRVVGVAPPRFNGVTRLQGRRVLWMPLSARASIVQSSPVALVSRDTALLTTFARLQPGVTIDQASAAIRVASTRAVAVMAPSERPMAYTAEVIPLRGRIKISGSEEQPIMEALQLGAILGSAAILILIIACTNVSAIAVGAAVARRHEIAVRMSLGASRSRVVRQLLTESVLLAIAGGSLGLLIYWWITKAIGALAMDVDLAPDFGTVAFTMFFALGTGIVFGMSPALHATRQAVGEVLKDSATGVAKRSRLQRVFVVAQIAFTQPLLVGLAMILGVVGGAPRQQWRDGLDSRIAHLRIHSVARVGDVRETQAALARLDARLAEIPGVTKVVRVGGGFSNATVSVHSSDRGSSTRAMEPLSVQIEGGGPGRFALLGIPIVRGRELTATDSANNVVIGSDFARSVWPKDDPIGRRFVETLRTGETRELTVIGVFDAAAPMPRSSGTRIYAMPNWVADAYLIRTAGLAAPVFSRIRAAVRAELPTAPVTRLETIKEREDADALESIQVSMSAAGGGLLALALASIGLYGVVALAVTQRKREIGVRMALGARAAQVVAMLFASGIRLSLLGLALGLPLSLLALRMLPAVVRTPPTSALLVGGGIAIAVIGVASLATWVPARRAASIDPVSALRSE